jgi:hypothetical protein
MVSPIIRRAAAQILGERPFGACQFARHAIRGELSEAAAFNGQPGRQKLFLDLIRTIRFDEIVETGSFRGDTTAFMARRSGLPIFTSESSPRHYGYSHARFVLDRKVHVAFSDSRQFLRSHFGKPEHAARTVFAYLDAHWGQDLPLFEETRILLALPPTIVVMIDDFQVPDDAGYAFDSYGPGATLNLEYLRLEEIPEARIFLPALHSSGEAGFRRGCVVLAKNGPVADLLKSIDSLRPWKLQ